MSTGIPSRKLTDKLGQPRSGAANLLRAAICKFHKRGGRCEGGGAAIAQRRVRGPFVDGRTDERDGQSLANWPPPTDHRSSSAADHCFLRDSSASAFIHLFSGSVFRMLNPIS
ncbi:hypothetical protein RB195_007899 [Necator americanus]|uniref:Uncharacterized protein n=1 Tax=Necator americanus TaxID=51031 RepID=A0ABR1C231_NECAM